MKKSITILLIFAIASFGLTLGCTKKSEEIKIGIVGPFSGVAANWGDQFRKGITLALSEVPKTDRKMLKLIYEDSEGDPRKAVSAVQKLISANNVNIIIGPLSSTEVLSVAPIVEKAGVLLLTPTAPHTDITNAGDYIFRIYPSDERRSIMLADFTYKELGARRVGIVYRADEFGSAVSSSYLQRLKDLGVRDNELYSESYEPGDSDFRTILAKLKARNPSVVLLVGHSSDLGFIVRQSAEIGFNPQFLSTADFENPEVLKIAGEAAEGVIYGSIVFDVNSPDSLIRSFRERYQELFRTTEEPSLVVALCYDAFRVVYNAIDRARSENTDLIKNMLYKTEDFPAVTGNITFDENGDVTKSWGLKTVKNGKFEILKETYDH